MYTCIECKEVITWLKPVLYVGYDVWVHVACFMPYIQRNPAVVMRLRVVARDVLKEIEEDE